MFVIRTKQKPRRCRGGAFENALMLSGDQWRNPTGPPKQE
jgi:hypothetical protein